MVFCSRGEQSANAAADASPLAARLAELTPPALAGARPRAVVQSAAADAITVAGLGGFARIGDCCEVACGDGAWIAAEVTAARRRSAVVAPYEASSGLAAGAEVRPAPDRARASPDRRWLGRIVDAMGRPLDGRPPPPGGRARRLERPPPGALERGRLGARLPLGVRALDLFAPCLTGQRLGLFAGSGVGKSTLLAMIARASAADALVVALIGERGRELREFVEDSLGEVGLARALVVVSTSDESAMMRKRAAYLAMTAAEALRDEGADVLLLMDSVTRFAQALREIRLAAGEPPSSRGFPPSVFAELPRLLERAGPGEVGRRGSISALFTVLVDGDDMNEPIADATRGILDGHAIMDRAIAERGRFPAIDVNKSVSRSTPGCYSAEEAELVGHARRLLRAHEDLGELIRLGAYKAGSDPLIDEAIARLPAIEALLRQAPGEPASPGDAVAMLAAALGRGPLAAAGVGGQQ